MLIERWSFIDALYMTTITLATVGFSEVQPLSTVGRLFTIGLILTGVGTVAYGFGVIGEFILTTRAADQIRRRQLMRMINRLESHVIICGYGRVGRSAVASLRDSNRVVVIIEKEPIIVNEISGHNLIAIEGDATKDEVLRQAGVERANSLIVCTGDDSLNLFIVLSARALNADLYIITRSVDADNESKMHRAGANRVVSPYNIGGKHMANIVLRPHVTDFFDVVTLDDGIELWLEELIIHETSGLIGQTVGGANVRQQTGVTLIAVLRQNHQKALIPNANTRLEAGDELIVLGTREQLATLEQLTATQVPE